MPNIEIASGDITLLAELNLSPTARRIWDALPLVGTAHVWGDEIYFRLPLELAGEPTARQEMDYGEIAYWVEERALCLFFGPTPLSVGGAPRAFAPVTPVGRILSEPSLLRVVPDGVEIWLRRAGL